MKEHDDILTSDETERLCRMYLECGLSVLEEAELKYLLGNVSYSSEIIDSVREDMMIESMICRKPAKRAGYRKPVWSRIAGVAASVALLFGCSVMLMLGNDAGQTGENQVVAYEAGHKLDDEEACVAVRNSMEKAEALMAKAEAIERQYTEKQIQIMNLK